MRLRNYLNESDVGMTIMSQINHIDKHAMLAWGSKNLVFFKKGLQFTVSGPKFKGKIIIELNGRDLYDISFGKVVKLEWKVSKKLTDVHVEDLVKTIDGVVG